MHLKSLVCDGSFILVAVHRRLGLRNGPSRQKGKAEGRAWHSSDARADGEGREVLLVLEPESLCLPAYQRLTGV